MEQQRQANNLIVVVLLLTTIANVPATSSNQNLYSLTTTINIGSVDGDQLADDTLNTTTSIYQEPTTYLPVSTSTQTEELLNASETRGFLDPSYRYGDSRENDDDPEGPPDHAIPYSVHEEPRDVPTRPKYVAPGLWAKPPAGKNVQLDFVPTKLHAQVRGIHTVKRLPQREAIKSAKTDEERLNAHRLKEVVTNSKVNTVYSEEGYEDSAYDHAGHVRDADFHEGYARKLHDREKDNFLKGKKKKVKHRNLVPNEFKEYDEDYLDHYHLEENRKHEDNDNTLVGHDRNIWEGSETDPKFVAENGIRELEENIEKEAEEAEKSSRIYQNAQETKFHDDATIDSSESEEYDNDDLKDEEDKPIAIEKKKSKFEQDEKADALSKETKKSHKLKPKKDKTKKKKKLHRENYETTILPSNDETYSIDDETPARPHGFVPSDSQLYSVDQTTLHYVTPATTTSFPHIDEPTTVSYSQLFWNYFKTQQDLTTTESSMLTQNATNVNLRPIEQTPIAVATIDGQGPYLLVTREKTTTLPSTFLGSYSFHPQRLFSDRVEFDPSSTQGHRLRGLDNDINYVGGFNDMTAASTVATFTSMQPLPFQSLKFEDTESTSLTTLLDSIGSSSTPAATTLNITREAYSHMVVNPFLGPILNNSNVTVIQNKSKYKVLIRPSKKPKKAPKSTVQQSSHQQASSSSASQEEDKNKKISDELSTKYNKVLDYIVKNKQTAKPLPEGRKISSPGDFIPFKPPLIPQRVYPIFPTDRPPIVSHSSVSVESVSPRDVNSKSPLRDQRRFQSTESPFRLDPFFIQPIHLTYRKNLLPITKLLPPPPPSLIASAHTNYYNNKRNNNYLSYIGSKSQQRDNAWKYLPLVNEASWKTRYRRKRSDDEGEFRDGDRDDAADVKATANNGVTNDGKSEQRDKGPSSRATGNAKRKSSNRTIIRAPIDASDTTRPRNGESVTSTALVNRSSTIADGKSENVEARHEDAKATTIESPNLAERESASFQDRTRQDKTNDNSTEKSTSKKRNVSQHEIQPRRNSKNKTNKKEHEELLNESPKISGDVIDKEIAAHFNEEGNSETSAEIEDEKKIEVEVPNFDYVEEFAEESPAESSATTEVVIDLKKYPFYNNEDLPSTSALKYIVDPRTIPWKTSRGMEFYNSRNTYKQCDEVEPNLDKVLPEKEEPVPDRGPQEDLPHLRGLGDKLDCFKAKYFDENPFDNPLFAEKSIEDPIPPSELDPASLASKIALLPANNERIVHELSKRPERNGRQWRSKSPQYEAQESIRVNYKHDPQTGRGRNAYLHTVRGSRPYLRRMKTRRSKVKISTITTTTQIPKIYQTASYQNQVYEDVMGNIRNLAKASQIQEVTTTLSPATQILATAGSENMLKIADIALSSSKEKTATSSNVTAVTNNTKFSEIKGLIPPPKYSAPRQIVYRKYRPPPNRMSLLRSSNLPRIIAHRHTIKIKKRSTTNDTAINASESTNEENDKSSVEKSLKVDEVGNNTTEKFIEEMTSKTDSMPEMLDLETEESRQVRVENRSFSSTTLKVDDKKRRRNSTTSNDEPNEPSQKVIYTIRDRIRYSKPKWDTRGFGKFSTSPKTVDTDNRRKEPRYTQLKRKRPYQQNNSTILPYNSTNSASGIEDATSSIDRESGTIDAHRSQESLMQELIYGRKNGHSKPEKIESIIRMKFKESAKEEPESTTNMYRVREEINEDVPTTTMKLMSPLSSKEILSLQDYLESEPPGYAETFPEEATTPSSKHRANMNHESEDSNEKQEEETDYLKKVANPWEDDSSEKTEEQMTTPMKSPAQDDSSEEHSSKESSISNRPFFNYAKRPSWAENEHSAKTRFYPVFPFSRYKSKSKEESDEDDSDEDEEGSEDYVFPWHADIENQRRRLHDLDRYEYPWETRERLAKNRRAKQKRASRLKKLIFSDEDEEESKKYIRSLYPWEKYDVPSNDHVNTGRNISSPRNVGDNEESTTEQSFVKFSSRYSSSVKPLASNAREISRSIKKFLDDDLEAESKEEASKETEDHSSQSFPQKSPSTNRGISRGMLVPEDITQPPRRTIEKKKTRRTDQNVSSNLRFGSKELKSKEIDDDNDDDNEKKFAVDYLKLSNGNLDDSESQIKTGNSQLHQLSNITKESSAPIAQRKKRRRRILKNNSTISLNNASTSKSTRRRRKRPQVSTTTPATSSANSNLEKSIFTVVRRNYSTTGDIKMNRSDSLERTPAVKTSITDNAEEESSSTPKTRTIEHRSRVSKEKIVTKTTYPGEGENFDSTKSTTSTEKEPMKKLKIRLSSRKSNNKRDDGDADSNDKEMSMEEKDEEESYEHKFVNEDEIERMTEKANLKHEDNPFQGLGMRKDEVKRINDFSNFDGIISDDNDDRDFGSALASETYVVNKLLQNIPPNRTNRQDEKKTENKSSETKEGWKKQIGSEETDEVEGKEGVKEKRRSLLRAKFIKDPERRLYYYVERK